MRDNLIFLSKYLQMSVKSYNFATDYRKFINFIKKRERLW